MICYFLGNGVAAQDFFRLFAYQRLFGAARCHARLANKRTFNDVNVTRK
jgi:hypothetical protein